MIGPAICMVLCIMLCSDNMEACVENMKPDGTYQVGPDGYISNVR